MESSNNLGEYKESIVRPKALPREVEKVWNDIEYSNKLRKVHDIMKKLDLPDSRDDMIRKELLKQDDNVLEDLVKKSKKDIMIFLKEEKSNDKEIKINIKNQENRKQNEESQKLNQHSIQHHQHQKNPT